jgi:hypothetical protein
MLNWVGLEGCAESNGACRFEMPLATSTVALEMSSESRGPSSPRTPTPPLTFASRTYSLVVCDTSSTPC